MSNATLLTPPAFDPTQWVSSPNNQGPVWYHGTKFDFDAVAALLQFNEDEATVTFMNEVTTLALNLQLETPANDPNYPIYFEVGGLTYHYVFSLWADRVIIEVHNHEYDLLSAMFPETEEQLRHALTTIVNDLCKN